MSDLFYVFGIALMRDGPRDLVLGAALGALPGLARRCTPACSALMGVLVVGSCAFAIALSREEAEHRSEEVAEFEAEQAAEEAEAPAEEATTAPEEPPPPAPPEEGPAPKTETVELTLARGRRPRLRAGHARGRRRRGLDRVHEPVAGAAQRGDRGRRRDARPGRDRDRRRRRPPRPPSSSPASTSSTAPSPATASPGWKARSPSSSRPGAPRRPATLADGGEALPRHHLRVPDERARLGAHARHARVARLRGGARARPGRPDPVQHVLDPRVGRQPLPRAPRTGEAAQVGGSVPRRRRRRLLGAVGQGRGLRALSVRGRRVRARARSTGWPSS